MKALFPLAILVTIGLFIPVYAQNVSHDEIDVKIRELIQDCQEKIMQDNTLTDAEKTVAKRNCETEITNEYKNVENDHKELAEKRARLQNMQNCNDWYPQYSFLTESQFRLQKHESIVNDCIILYNDAIWEYVGEDRLEKLSERLDEIKIQSAENIEPEPNKLEINVAKLEPSIVNTQQNINNDSELQERVKFLEEEIKKKDAIIQEQLNVIMELANRIRNVVGSLNAFFMNL